MLWSFFLLIASTALGQAIEIKFPVQYTVNKSLSSGDIAYGAALFEAVENGTDREITYRSFVVFNDVDAYEFEDTFAVRGLFLREAFFEHVILKKKVVESDFTVVFERFSEVAGDRRCAEFSLSVAEPATVLRLTACFDGDSDYRIKRISDALPVYNSNRVVTFDFNPDAEVFFDVRSSR